MFQRLLVCTDLTDGLQRLVNFVPSLAASGAKQIVFLHVIPLSEDQAIPHIDEEQTTAVRDRLSPTQVPDGVEVQVEVLWGKPVDLILETARTSKSDLIILGTLVHSLLSEKLFGCTTTGVAQHTKAPVLIFRPQMLCTYTDEELDLRCRHLFRYLLLPYDGSKAADHLIEQIKSHAQTHSSERLQECLLCWTIEEGGHRGIPREAQTKEAAARLEVAKATLETLDIKVGSEIRYGESILELLAAAAAHSISAIACTIERHGTLLEWTVPSFTQEILRRSWHPVLYFPASKS